MDIDIQKCKDIRLEEINFLKSLLDTRGSCDWAEHYYTQCKKIKQRIKELSDG